jgi:hypothetical protein
MTRVPNTRLGPYRIASAPGAGGMGVYDIGQDEGRHDLTMELLDEGSQSV